MKEASGAVHEARRGSQTFGVAGILLGLLFMMGSLTSAHAYTVNFVNNTGLPSAVLIMASAAEQLPRMRV